MINWGEVDTCKAMIFKLMIMNGTRVGGGLVVTLMTLMTPKPG